MAGQSLPASRASREVHSTGMSSAAPSRSPTMSSASRIDHTCVSPQDGQVRRVLMGGIRLTLAAFVSIPGKTRRPVAGHRITTMAMRGLPQPARLLGVDKENVWQSGRFRRPGIHVDSRPQRAAIAPRLRRAGGRVDIGPVARSRFLILELRTLYFEDLSVGLTERLSKTVASSDVVGFAEVTGDRNPIHLSEHFAAKTRFGTRI